MSGRVLTSRCGRTRGFRQSPPPRPENDSGVYRDPNLSVNHLIDFFSKEWKVDLIHELVEPVDIPLMLGLKPSKTFQVDNYVWCYNKSGLYTVRSGYKIARNLKVIPEEASKPSITKLKAYTWKLKTSKNIKHFIWLDASGGIASCGRLVDMHCGNDRTYPRCGADDESVNHMLFECHRHCKFGLYLVSHRFRACFRVELCSLI